MRFELINLREKSIKELDEKVRLLLFPKSSQYDVNSILPTLNISEESNIEDIQFLLFLIKDISIDLVITDESILTYFEDTNLLKQYIKDNTNNIKNNKKIFMTAIMLQKVDIVKLILESGINLKEYHGLDIKWACLLCNKQIINMLIEYGSNLNNIIEDTLLIATYAWGVNGVKFILDKGKNARYNKNLALNCAIITKDNETVKCLLETDLDVNANQSEALSVAVEHDFTEIVESLIKAGANAKSRNNQHIKTAVDNNNKDIIKILIKNGAYWPIKNTSVIFKLMLKDENDEIASLLLKSIKLKLK